MNVDWFCCITNTHKNFVRTSNIKLITSLISATFIHPYQHIFKRHILSKSYSQMASATQESSAVPPFILISESTVEKSLTMSQAIHINAQAFLASYEQTAKVPSYGAIVEPASGSDGSVSNASLFKPAQVCDALGLKVVCVRPNNGRFGLPTVPAVILLNDRETGYPISLIQATYLTALRTAAGSGAATSIGAKQDASILTVFGAGLQAREHIKAMICVRSIKVVHVVNRTPERALELIQLLSTQYPDIQFKCHSSSSVDATDKTNLKSAISSSHIICTTTNSNVALLSLSDISPGCHINAIGSYLPQMHELSSDLVAASRIAIDGPIESARHAGDLHTPLAANLIRPEDLIHIGAYLPREKYAHKIDSIGIELPAASTTSTTATASNLIWRQNENDVTLFKSVGSAIQDITTGYAVFQVCQSTKQGKPVEW